MKVFVDNRESGPLTQRQWKEARERLTLARAFEGVDLDIDLIEKGRAVVGYAFLRLCPEPHAKGA